MSVSLSELKNMSLASLKLVAREHGIAGFSKYTASTKDELAGLINKAMKGGKGRVT